MKILIIQRRSVTLKMRQIRFVPGFRPGPLWGRPPSRLGRGYPLLIPYPFDAYGVSISGLLAPPLWSSPLNSKV